MLNAHSVALTALLMDGLLRIEVLAHRYGTLEYWVPRAGKEIPVAEQQFLDLAAAPGRS